jgi:hypothetical protein
MRWALLFLRTIGSRATNQGNRQRIEVIGLQLINQTEVTMKSIKLALLAIVLVGLFGVGNVFAAATATIDVSATVLGTCSFDTTSYTMAFGDIDPASSGDVTQTVDLIFTCSNGTTYTLDDISGPQSMTGTVPPGSLAYSIDGYTLSELGTGSSQTLTITGRIADTDYQVAAADVYTDTLTIDINP